MNARKDEKSHWCDSPCFFNKSGFMSIVKEYISIPTNVAVFEKQKHSIDTSIEASANASSPAFSLSEKKISWILQDKRREKAEIVYDFKGFPIKKTKVDVLPELKVIPGGQSIGVKLHSVGVLVVGFHQITTADGKKNHQVKPQAFNQGI
ncbi:hypothetical protein BsIDN1_42320 [Bacillus safensis]|uniref:Uncharacterized protein n=1 Tax=Bacillus safensis TaxID=561879 RepID=A0A5S9MEQ5_BACIA|nr:hypothetical protein BsIDN1_42320 [Bacillus safensis]